MFSPIKTLILFREILISIGKSDCYNDTFTDVQFTSLLAKNI